MTRPISRPRSASRTVWLPVDVLAELEAEAARLELSISWVLVRVWRERKAK